MAISLASIAKSTAVKAPRIVYYAVPGFGKTTMAAGAPDPIFLMTEEGFGSLTDLPHFQNEDGGDVLQTWEEVKGALTALSTEQHDYKTVVLDTLDTLEPLIWKRVAEDHSKDNIEDLGYGKGYIYALDYWRELTAALDWLRDHRGISCILIAHSDIIKYDAPDTERYDRFTMRLHQKARALVNDWCDCLLFGNYRVHIAKQDVGFNKTVSRGVGHGERILYTSERPAYTAKNRYGLPHEIELPGDTPPDPQKVWGAFLHAMTQALNGKGDTNG